MNRKSPIVKYGVILIAWIVWYGGFYEDLRAKIQENRTSISTLRVKLSTLEKERKRLEKEAKSIQTYEASLAAIKKTVIQGEDPQVVAANLQNMVLTYASKKNIEIVTYRTSSTTTWKDYKVARTNFTFKCNPENFVELLRFFKETKRLIRPSRINIVWVRGRNSHLRVIVDIEALCLKKA